MCPFCVFRQGTYSSNRVAAPRSKGIQPSKKSKASEMFEKIRSDLGPEALDLEPPPSSSQVAAPIEKAPQANAPLSKRDAIHFTVAESISARLSREGSLESFNVKGELHLLITDPSLAKVKIDVLADTSHGAQFKTHPYVDKARFNSGKTIQVKDASRGFPVNASTAVLRWTATAPANATDVAPITFTIWVNKGTDTSFNLTVEYEATEPDLLRDVVLTIPYSTSEPAISSFDAVYEVSGDTLEWTIGTISESNLTGSFDFEAQADDEAEFFPMKAHFSMSKPFVEVDVSTDLTRLLVKLILEQVASISLVDMDENTSFSKEVKSVADSYNIE